MAMSRMNEGRLVKIASLIPQVHTVADIGTDHGRLPLMLLKTQTAQHIIATDCSEKSLRKARKRFLECGMEQQVTFRTGDGLSVLTQGEAQAIVLSGMGGKTIQDILRAGRNIIGEATLVICPQIGVSYLRTFLLEQGFAITDEAICQEEGRFYPIVQAKAGAMAQLSYKELLFGPILLQKKQPELLAYVQHRQRVLANKMQGRVFTEGANEMQEMQAIREVCQWLQQ